MLEGVGTALSLFLALALMIVSIVELGLILYGLYREVKSNRDNRILWALILLFVPLGGFLWYFLRYNE